jgi:hypothetical protein
VKVDTSKWSGEGTFTQTLIDQLQRLSSIDLMRVEDAPASRSDADYNFISNEIFVVFGTRVDRTRRFRFLPPTRRTHIKLMSISGLEATLTSIPEIGAPDYADEGMLQYLRTERIVPPYQTRGYKLVELVRVYDAGDGPRPANAPPRFDRH